MTVAKVNLIDKTKSVFFKDLEIGQLFVYGGELHVKTNLLTTLNALMVENNFGHRTFDQNICVIAVESIDVHL